MSPQVTQTTNDDEHLTCSDKAKQNQHAVMQQQLRHYCMLLPKIKVVLYLIITATTIINNNICISIPHMVETSQQRGYLHCS